VHFETIMLENGELTEGSSTTVHVVTGGVIRNAAHGHHILPGRTRTSSPNSLHAWGGAAKAARVGES